MNKELSNCCSAPMLVATADEGTSYYICSECKQPFFATGGWFKKTGKFIKCKTCKKEFYVQKSLLRIKKYCSCKCYYKSLEGFRGESAFNYKKNSGISRCHKWLNEHYGKPNECEGKDCRKNSNSYDWALKKGCKYERKKSNFLRLCRSCHRRYDLTPKKKRQAIINLIKYKSLCRSQKKY